jgi:hypothetical protein
VTAEELEVSNDGDFCNFATENPRCPYVALIRDCRAKIDRIEKALIGEDMKSGLVADVNSMKSAWRAIQPYVLVAATALLTWLVSHIHW